MGACVLGRILVGEFSVWMVSQGFERWPEGLCSSVGSCEQRGQPGDDKKVLSEGGRQEAPSMRLPTWEGHLGC